VTGEMKILNFYLSRKFIAIAIPMFLATGCGTQTESISKTDSETQIQECTPGYVPCLPPMSDYDCKGGQGDGPGYTGPVEVFGLDKYKLDRDKDGFAC
jgi:hypothetical protein